MLTTIILVSLGLAALIALTVWFGLWLDKTIDEVYGHEEPESVGEDADEHKNVTGVWG